MLDVNVIAPAICTREAVRQVSYYYGDDGGLL